MGVSTIRQPAQAVGGRQQGPRSGERLERRLIHSKARRPLKELLMFMVVCGSDACSWGQRNWRTHSGGQTKRVQPLHARYRPHNASSIVGMEVRTLSLMPVTVSSSYCNRLPAHLGQLVDATAVTRSRTRSQRTHLRARTHYRKGSSFFLKELASQNTQ
jgi:hypothetical protein